MTRPLRGLDDPRSLGPDPDEIPRLQRQQALRVGLLRCARHEGVVHDTTRQGHLREHADHGGVVARGEGDHTRRSLDVVVGMTTRPKRSRVVSLPILCLRQASYTGKCQAAMAEHA